MPENKYRGEVLIELDRPRKFRLTFNEIIEAEELLGEQFDVTKVCESAKKIRAVLYAGLKNDDPELTLESVGHLLGLWNQAAIVNAIMSASLGLSEEEIEQKVKEAEARKNAQSPASDGQSKNVSAGQPASA